VLLIDFFHSALARLLRQTHSQRASKI